MFKDTSKSYHRSKYRFCIPHNHGIHKHNAHTIFERKWYTKPKCAVKIVKGLPHMCSCHQPNSKRGLVTYTRWITTEPNCYLCHTIMYDKIIHFVSSNTHITIEYSYMFLAHLNLVLPNLESGYIHLPPKLACTTRTNPRRYIWETTIAA